VEAFTSYYLLQLARPERYSFVRIGIPFLNEFSEPDPVLESQFSDKLYNFIDESPDHDLVVTCEAFIKAIS
jgi:hypothetical protein